MKIKLFIIRKNDYGITYMYDGSEFYDTWDSLISYVIDYDLNNYPMLSTEQYLSRFLEQTIIHKQMN